MQFVHSLPAATAFKGRGLLGYAFGPLTQKDLDVYYVQVDGGHDTYMVSKRITRTYYILSGSGYFTMSRQRYHVSPGMLVEVPPKVEYSYSGKMELIAFSRPRWSFGNDRHTRWNEDVFGADVAAPLPNGSWCSKAVRGRIFGKSLVVGCLGLHQQLWKVIPTSFTSVGPLRAYSGVLHRLARTQDRSRRVLGAIFLRNRPALEFIRRIAERRGRNDTLNLAVLGCSIGAEVYSIAWTIRSARPDLKLVIHAVDPSRDAVETGRRGRYSLKGPLWSGRKLFERLTKKEMEELFDREEDEATIKRGLREGIEWHIGDPAGSWIDALGPQDVVVAGNFLCHMDDSSAETCLRNISRLVAPQGYLITHGVDLEVRTRVAQATGWTPVQELLEEIHEGDPSLRRLWPCHYAGLEPLNKERPDWRLRYAAVFQVGSGGGDGQILEAAENRRSGPIVVRTEARTALQRVSPDRF